MFYQNSLPKFSHNSPQYCHIIFLKIRFNFISVLFNTSSGFLISIFKFPDFPKQNLSISYYTSLTPQAQKNCITQLYFPFPKSYTSFTPYIPRKLKKKKLEKFQVMSMHLFSIFYTPHFYYFPSWDYNVLYGKSHGLFLLIVYIIFIGQLTKLIDIWNQFYQFLLHIPIQYYNSHHWGTFTIHISRTDF